MAQRSTTKQQNCYIDADGLVRLKLDEELMGVISQALRMRLLHIELYPDDAPEMYERFLIEEAKDTFLKAYTVRKTKLKLPKSQFFYALHPENMMYVDEATAALIYGLVAPVHSKNH